jgi:hypothetical protein
VSALVCLCIFGDAGRAKVIVVKSATPDAILGAGYAGVCRNRLTNNAKR